MIINFDIEIKQQSQGRKLLSAVQEIPYSK